MRKRKQKRIVITEKLKAKYREKHICLKCNSPFETEAELQWHMQEQHGDYSIEETIQKQDPKASWRSPPRKEWLAKTKNITWMWNPWRKEYFQYKLGIGCISNDFHPFVIDDKRRFVEAIICDENSEYFTIWRKVVSGRGKIPTEPTPRPKLRPLGVLKENEKLNPKGEYHTCKGCKRLIRIIWKGELQNLILCPKCGKDIFKGKPIRTKKKGDKKYEMPKMPRWGA